MTYPGWSSAPTATMDVALLYERHAPEIHDFLARTVHDHAAAEDLTQNTFIRLMERGESVRETEKVRPWLFTVAHNLAVTHVTRRKAPDPIEAAFEIASGEKGPEDEAVAADAARLVWDAARSLEPRQYAVLDLTVRRGFSIGEIAEVLEITPAHAAVVVHRAREALAQAIRLLVVVRQRRHCARLAELIPAGTEVLTPDLRASADRHMRRCEACKEVGEKLTQPAELLSVLPLLPLPIAAHPLTLFPHLAHHAAAATAAGHTAAAANAAGHATALQHLRTLGQRGAQTLQQPAVLAGIAALAVAGTGVGLGLAIHGGGGPQRGAPVATSQSPRSGIGGGETAVPPLTGSTERQAGNGNTPPPGPIRQDGAYGDDFFEVDCACITPVDQPPPTPPSPTPAPPPILLDQTVLLPPPVPATGAHVRVYDPTRSSTPPSITVYAAGQPLPLPVAARLRTF